MTTTTVDKMPIALHLIGPGAIVFQQVIHHARFGYTVNPGMPVDIFPNGHASIHLLIGSPDPAAIAAADQSIIDALHLEEIEYQRAVKNEAKRLMEAQKQAELEAELAIEEAAYEKRIRDLRKATSAAISKLQ